MDEFSGKIKAGKDSQLDDDFNIVARVEALIAGWGVGEALRRAEAYRLAGADAILIHSKMSRPDEILEFCQEWGNRAPVVIVPTKYYSTPTDVFRRAEVSLVIWANHMIRTAVTAMQASAREVFESETLVVLEDRIATVKELFRLQGADELVEAEKRYFNPEQNRTRAIILAASRGRALESLTRDKPKVMLPINGRPLLRHMADEFKKQGVNDITVVAGYKAEAIDVQGVRKVLNPDHETTGELQSLICARDSFADDVVLTYGDLLFRNYILKDLLEEPGDLVMVVDSANSETRFTGSPDYTWCSVEDDRSLLRADVELKAIADCYDQEGPPPSGRWIGMLHIRAQGMEWIKQALLELEEHEDYQQLCIPDLLEYLVKQGRTIKVHYIHGHWMDVNALEDLDRAGDFTKK
jgi:phosphoenolpyruvate phosphomutase